MYFYNILEPRFICDSAIKVLRNERKKISSEIEKLKTDNKNVLENYLKIEKLFQLSSEYEILIYKLDKLGDFGTQQIQQLAENGERKGDCIF